MHLSRKLFHASGVAIVACYYWGGLGRGLVAGVLGAIAGLLLLIDLARAARPGIQERFERLFSLLLDPKDATGLNGSTLYFGGCTLAVALVPLEPACGGILALAIGDPAAAIVGSSVRSPRRGKVSLAGSAACFVASVLACALFRPWPAALAGGAAATLLEAFSGSKLDNLTIPVGVSLTLHLL